MADKAHENLLIKMVIDVSNDSFSGSNHSAILVKLNLGSAFEEIPMMP